MPFSVRRYGGARRLERSGRGVSVPPPLPLAFAFQRPGNREDKRAEGAAGLDAANAILKSRVDRAARVRCPGWSAVRRGAEARSPACGA